MRTCILCLMTIVGCVSLPEAGAQDLTASPRAQSSRSKPAAKAAARILKVSPHYLDLRGRHSLSPSLYDRDAYQAFLRENPQERSGLRFDIQWRSAVAAPLKLRVEARGAQGKELTHTVLEQTVGQTGLSKWTVLTLTGREYEKFGSLAAWRATLWDGGNLMSEQKSFLW